MSSQLDYSSKSVPFGSSPSSPSPIDYPYRQFLPLGDYTEDSIQSYLSKRGRYAYRTKKLEGRRRKVIVLYTSRELKEDDLDEMMTDSDEARSDQ